MTRGGRPPQRREAAADRPRTFPSTPVLEWMLSEAGVIQTELEEDPRPGAVAQARARRDEGTASGAASSSAGWVRSSRVSDDEDDM